MSHAGRLFNMGRVVTANQGADMVSGLKLMLVGSVILALGLARDVGAQTLKPATDSGVQVFGAVSSTAPIAKAGKRKAKKVKHKKKAAKRHNKKLKHQAKGKRKAKA
jgi:hypothetical protein